MGIMILCINLMLILIPLASIAEDVIPTKGRCLRLLLWLGVPKRYLFDDQQKEEVTDDKAVSAEITYGASSAEPTGKVNHIVEDFMTDLEKLKMFLRQRTKAAGGEYDSDDNEDDELPDDIEIEHQAPHARFPHRLGEEDDEQPITWTVDRFLVDLEGWMDPDRSETSSRTDDDLSEVSSVTDRMLTSNLKQTRERGRYRLDSVSENMETTVTSGRSSRSSSLSPDDITFDESINSHRSMDSQSSMATDSTFTSIDSRSTFARVATDPTRTPSDGTRITGHVDATFERHAARTQMMHQASQKASKKGVFNTLFKRSKKETSPDPDSSTDSSDLSGWVERDIAGMRGGATSGSDHGSEISADFFIPQLAAGSDPRAQHRGGVEQRSKNFATIRDQFMKWGAKPKATGQDIDSNFVFGDRDSSPMRSAMASGPEDPAASHRGPKHLMHKREIEKSMGTNFMITPRLNPVVQLPQHRQRNSSFSSTSSFVTSESSSRRTSMDSEFSFDSRIANVRKTTDVLAPNVRNVPPQIKQFGQTNRKSSNFSSSFTGSAGGTDLTQWVEPTSGASRGSSGGQHASRSASISSNSTGSNQAFQWRPSDLRPNLSDSPGTGSSLKSVPPLTASPAVAVARGNFRPTVFATSQLRNPQPQGALAQWGGSSKSNSGSDVTSDVSSFQGDSPVIAQGQQPRRTFAVAGGPQRPIRNLAIDESDDESSGSSYDSSDAGVTPGNAARQTKKRFETDLQGWTD